VRERAEAVFVKDSQGMKMRISVASGKGGTGKTTVSVNLALCAPGSVQLLDCDVEEPNCHIFLKAEEVSREVAGVPVPVVDEGKCTGCGECGRMCAYHAILCVKKKVLVFEELCHSCGGCMKVCPECAIREEAREIGVVERGRRDGVELVTGRLKVGRAMSPPLIRAVKQRARGEGLTLIDCPPGTSCPVIAALGGSDFVILVTEPTPFGLHDLTLAVETVRVLGLPFGVVINRADAGDDRVKAYCEEEGISVLLEVCEDRRIAEATSRGESMVEALPEYRARFEELWGEVSRRAKGGAR